MIQISYFTDATFFHKKSKEKQAIEHKLNMLAKNLLTASFAKET